MWVDKGIRFGMILVDEIIRLLCSEVKEHRAVGEVLQQEFQQQHHTNSFSN